MFLFSFLIINIYVCIEYLALRIVYSIEIMNCLSNTYAAK